MFSDTDKFIALLSVYKSKAQHDVEVIMQRIERILLTINKPYDYINEQEVKHFCKYHEKFLILVCFFN
jgi:hypothetical protein